jgi:hypothetical protein
MSETLDPDRYRLSESDHQRIFERRINPHVFKGATASRRPVAVIFGGQPGAGKSAAVQFAVSELREQSGAAKLVGDDLRPYQLRYAALLRRDDTTAAFYTDRDTARWIEKSIAYASDNRYSIVVEGTMRDPNKVAATPRDFRGAGFAVDARGLAVNPRLSELGILERYEHQRAVRGMPATLDRIEAEGLSDRLRLVTRSQAAVFDSRAADRSTRSGARAAHEHEHERNRPLSLGETTSARKPLSPKLAKRVISNA